jgi:uncharacterized repeat protein (TIGR03803 family)
MKTPLPLLSVYLFIVPILIVLSSSSAHAQVPGLWGMTTRGGTSEAGTIFKTAPDGTSLAVQYSFTFQNQGSRPYIGAQLTQLANGKLYGVASEGGINNAGVLFEYDIATSTYTKKIDFTQSTGKTPQGVLVLAGNGKLYGMTSQGGTNSIGVIFEYDPATNVYTKKIDFSSAGGHSPQGNGLYLHTNGKFYGMTTFGGASNNGVLFEYDPATNVYTKKIDFTNNPNGASPYGSLMVTSGGKVFGLTVNGGANGQGILFEYVPSTNTLTKKIDFNAAIGSFPYSTLVEASNNRLYGVTPVNGSIYEYNPATNSITKKFDFSTPANGQFAYGTLVKGSNGKLYGMTNAGGSESGVLYEYDVSTNTFTKKHDFVRQTGYSPYGSLLLASNGNFYGLTYDGGAAGAGVLFEYNSNTNTYTKKIDFNMTPMGGYPYGGLMRATNNKLYGMTIQGGANDRGVIFEMDPVTTVFTKKHDFTEATGEFPQGNLTQAPNGKLYGLTASGGGSNDAGVIFEFDPTSGTYTKKHEFDDTNGSEPYGNLTLASNNKLYGMTSQGGTSGYGVLFEYNPATNTFTKKTEFNNTTVGFNPYDGLIQATNGKFYGLCRDGGLNGNGSRGTLFEYDLSSNSITVKVDFNLNSSANGETPEGGLVQAPNGKLYGTTRYGGTNGKGVLFEYDLTTNTFSKKFDFGGAASAPAEPAASLGLSSNGKLYGSTLFGGTSNRGVLFEYDITTNTLTKKQDFTGPNGAGLFYGRLLFVDCIKPVKPTITVSNANTATPTLTSSAASGNQWYRNSTLISSATSVSLNVTQAGVYKVEVVGNGCNSDFSDDVPIIVTGDLDNNSTAVSLYPNPTHDELTIDLAGFEKNVPVTISTIDLLGRSLNQLVAQGGHEVKLDVRLFTPGQYIILMQQGRTRIAKSFIKSTN